MKHKHINIYTNTSTSRQRKYVIWTNCVENWISDFVLFVLSGFSEELVLTCTVKVGGHEIMARFQERSLHLYIESSFYSNFQVRSKKKLRARLINRYFALSSVWFTLPDSFYNSQNPCHAWISGLLGITPTGGTGKGKTVYIQFLPAHLQQRR